MFEAQGWLLGQTFCAAVYECLRCINQASATAQAAFEVFNNGGLSAPVQANTSTAAKASCPVIAPACAARGLLAGESMSRFWLSTQWAGDFQCMLYTHLVFQLSLGACSQKLGSSFCVATHSSQVQWGAAVTVLGPAAGENRVRTICLNAGRNA